MNKHITPQMHKQIKSFWKWFEENEHELYQAVRGNGNYIEANKKLHHKLNTVSKRISIIFTLNTANPEKTKIIITAHGFPKLVPKVNALKENAPELKNWVVQALFQPCDNLETYKQGQDVPYLFGDWAVKTSDLYFSVHDYNTENKRLEIIVYFEDFKNQCEDSTTDLMIEIIILNLIGELVLRKSITSIKLAQLPQNTQNLIPLYQLQEHITFLNQINRKLKMKI